MRLAVGVVVFIACDANLAKHTNHKTYLCICVRIYVRVRDDATWLDGVVRLLGLAMQFYLATGKVATFRDRLVQMVSTSGNNRMGATGSGSDIACLGAYGRRGATMRGCKEGLIPREKGRVYTRSASWKGKLRIAIYQALHGYHLCLPLLLALIRQIGTCCLSYP